MVWSLRQPAWVICLPRPVACRVALTSEIISQLFVPTLPCGLVQQIPPSHHFGQLLVEKRRAAASAAKDVTAVSAVTPEETPALLKEVYRRSSLKKPRNLVGLSKDLPAAEMEGLLLQAITVDEDAVRALAQNRSLAVREFLTARKVPSDRLFMGEADVAPAQADWQPRAELSIEHH